MVKKSYVINFASTPYDFLDLDESGTILIFDFPKTVIEILQND